MNDFEKGKKIEGGVEVSEVTAEEIKNVEDLLEGNVEMSQEDVEAMKEQYNDLQDKIKWLEQKSTGDVEYTAGAGVLTAAAFVVGIVLAASGAEGVAQDVAKAALMGGFAGLAGTVLASGIGGAIEGTVYNAKAALSSLKAGNLEKKLAAVEA
jgi:hypothetical protein